MIDQPSEPTPRLDAAEREYNDDNLRNPELIDGDWATNVTQSALERKQTVKNFLGPGKEALYKMWIRLVSQWAQ